MRREKQERKLNRLKGYDYSLDGFYFVTICTKGFVRYFGRIQSQKIKYEPYGKIALKYWQEIPKHYENVFIDAFVIMPNHVHGIIIIDNSNVVTEQCSVTTPKPNKRFGLLSKVIKSFKEAVTKTIRKEFNDYEFAWQRSFHDRIARKNKSVLPAIRKYIKANPANWKFDRNNIRQLPE